MHVPTRTGEGRIDTPGYRPYVKRILDQRPDRRPHGARSAARDPLAAVARLQRLAGNRAVVRTLQRDRAKPEIPVRKGSKLSAADFANKLKQNKKVPGWLKNTIGSTASSLVLTGEPKPPSDKIGQFVDPLVKAFEARDWEITTARSTIEVSKDGKWRQLVTPDLGKGEQLGRHMKVGHDEEEFSPEILNSDLPEVIYGWTVPKTSSKLDHAKRNLVVIVTEIEVTAPNGRTKVFTPDEDNVAEAIIHEISVHAGRIAQNLPDLHDGNAVVKDIADQVGAYLPRARCVGRARAQPSVERDPQVRRGESAQGASRNGGYWSVTRMKA